MATYTLGEAISRIEGYLDKVAAEAQTFMKSEIAQKAKKGYATGALQASINIRVASSNSRGVGSDLHYAKYVDEGRGPVTAKNPSGRLHYYDTVLGRWVHPKSVDKMDGIYFIENTKNHLESTHIPL